MEDEKLAAYYDDLSRRGGGAARFKQGLGFSGNDDVPSRGSALPTTSSFLSSFVKASSPSKTDEFDKQAQLQSIQTKLSKKPKEKIRSRGPSPSPSSSPSRERIRDKRRKRSRSRSPSDRDSRRRSRSRSRDRNRDKRSKRRSRSHSRSRDRRSRRSRSREDESRHKYRSRSRERSKRQGSPAERRPEKGKKQGGGGIDFAKLIGGYNNMTPAERVKAKMKLQLSRTAENDEAIGKGSGWERFDFDKDAPLDDEEIEAAAEDDAGLVKRMGQSFRFSAVEARKEEEMKAVHDEAMFGAPSYPPPTETDDEEEEEEEEKSHKKENVPCAPMTSLLSDQVLTMPKGSWRDRARKP